MREKLEDWQAAAELASVRDRQALDHLPQDESTAWQSLWRDVDELLTRVGKKNEPANGRKEPETPKTKPSGRSLPPSGATGR